MNPKLICNLGPEGCRGPVEVRKLSGMDTRMCLRHYEWAAMKEGYLG